MKTSLISPQLVHIFSTQNVMRLFLILGIALFIQSCSTQEPEITLKEFSISGYIHKGPVEGAFIRIYEADGTTLISTSANETDKTGFYSVETAKPYTGMIVVKAEGGSYINEATQQEENFAGLSASGFRENSTQDVEISVTPVTSMIYDLALDEASSGNSVSRELLEEKAAMVLDALGLDNIAPSTIFGLQPTDLRERDTTARNGVNLRNTSDHYAFIIAALTQVGLITGKSVDRVISDFVDDLRDDSLFDSRTLLVEGVKALILNRGSQVYENGVLKLVGIDAVETDEQAADALSEQIAAIETTNNVGLIGRLEITDRNLTVSLPNTGSGFSDAFTITVIDANGNEQRVTGNKLFGFEPARFFVDIKDFTLTKPLSGLSFQYRDRSGDLVSYSQDILNAQIIAIHKIATAAGDANLAANVEIADIMNLYIRGDVPRNGFLTNPLIYQNAIAAGEQNDLNTEDKVKLMVELANLSYPVDGQFPFSFASDLNSFSAIGSAVFSSLGDYTNFVNGEFNNTNKLTSARRLQDIINAVRYLHDAKNPAVRNYPYDDITNFQYIFGLEASLATYLNSYEVAFASAPTIPQSFPQLAALVKAINYARGENTPRLDRSDYEDMGLTVWMPSGTTLPIGYDVDFETQLLNSIIGNSSQTNKTIYPQVPEDFDSVQEIQAVNNIVTRFMRLAARDETVANTTITVADLAVIGIVDDGLDTANEIRGSLQNVYNSPQGRASISSHEDLRNVLLSLSVSLRLATADDTGSSNSDSLTTKTMVGLDLQIPALVVGDNLSVIKLMDDGTKPELQTYTVTSNHISNGISIANVMLDENKDNNYTIIVNSQEYPTLLTVRHDNVPPSIDISEVQNAPLSGAFAVTSSNGLNIVFEGNTSMDVLEGTAVRMVFSYVDSNGTFRDVNVTQPQTTTVGSDNNWSIQVDFVNDVVLPVNGDYNVSARTLDPAGNEGTGINAIINWKGATPPGITRIYTTAQDGRYKVGSRIPIILEADQFLEPNSSVTVSLSDNLGTVVLSASQASTSLRGSYTVVSGAVSSDLNVTAITINGAKSTQAAPLNLDLNSAIPVGKSLGDISNIIIDGVMPQLARIYADDRTYISNEDLNITLQFDENMSHIGLVNITLDINGTEANASLYENNNTHYRFRANVQNLLTDNDGIDVTNLNVTGTLSDTAGNAFGAFTSTHFPNTRVSTIRPSIVGIQKVGAGRTPWLSAGDVFSIQITFDKVMGAGSFFQLEFRDEFNTTFTKDFNVTAAESSGGSLNIDRVITIPVLTASPGGYYSRDLNVTAITDINSTDLYSNKLNTNLPATTLSTGNSDVRVDSLPARLISVTIPDGRYMERDNFDINLTFNKPMSVTGTELLLDLNKSSTASAATQVLKTAAFLSGTDSANLIYRYTVQSGDLSYLEGGIKIRGMRVNSGNLIRGFNRDPLNISETNVTLAADSFDNVHVDGVKPVITRITKVVDTVADSIYNAGGFFDIQVEMSETMQKDSNLTLTFADGGNTTSISGLQANVIANTAGNVLVGRLTVPGLNTTIYDLNVTGVTNANNTAKDRTGNLFDGFTTANSAELLAGINLADNEEIRLNSAQKPLLQSVTTQAGTYNINDEFNITFVFDKNVTLRGLLELVLDINGTEVSTTNVVSGADNNNTLVFTYRVTDYGLFDGDGVSVVRLSPVGSSFLVGINSLQTDVNSTFRPSDNNAIETYSANVDTLFERILLTSVTTEPGLFGLNSSFDITFVFDNNVSVTGPLEVVLDIGGVEKTTSNLISPSDNNNTLVFSYQLTDTGLRDIDGVTVTRFVTLGTSQVVSVLDGGPTDINSTFRPSDHNATEINGSRVNTIPLSLTDGSPKVVWDENGTGQAIQLVFTAEMNTSIVPDIAEFNITSNSDTNSTIGIRAMEFNASNSFSFLIYVDRNITHTVNNAGRYIGAYTLPDFNNLSEQVTIKQGAFGGSPATQFLTTQGVPLPLLDHNVSFATSHAACSDCRLINSCLF